jgi:hypothetical protein
VKSKSFEEPGTPEEEAAQILADKEEIDTVTPEDDLNKSEA